MLQTIRLRGSAKTLFPYNFYQDTLAAAAVEFAVKDLFPRAEIQAASANRHHHFPAHHLALEMRIGIILARQIVPVLRKRLVGRKRLQPFFVIVMKAGFVVIDEDRGGDVHSIYKRQALGDAAFLQAGVDLIRDFDEAAPGRHLEPQLLAIAFHIKVRPEKRTLLLLGSCCGYRDLFGPGLTSERHTEAEHTLAGALFFEIPAARMQQIMDRYHPQQAFVVG